MLLRRIKKKMARRNTSNYGVEDRPFNMSEAFLLSLIDLRERISSYVLAGDVFAWYRGVMEYWNMCYFQFDEKENADLTLKLTEIKNYLNNPNSKQGAALLQAKIGIVEDKLHEVTKLLHVYLNNHERIFTKSKFTTWQDEIKNDFT